VQVVGRECAVCRARIVTARDGRTCASCAAALHDDCAASHACASAEKPASAPAALPAPRAALRGRWVYGLLGVLVAASVVPWFRHWRTERAIAERAAHRLGCAASEIEVVDGPGSGITVRGCGRSATYLRVCGQIDRAQCLEEVEFQPQGR
jgi:hypothetical protein